MALQYNVGLPAQQSPGSALFQGVLGGVQIGRDTSGNFAATISGLAVRRGDGTCVAIDSDADSLVDVTLFALAGIDPFVVRVPIQRRWLRRGDLIITNDSPFSSLFVLDAADDEATIRGIDPVAEQLISFVPAVNFLLPSIQVIAISLLTISLPLEAGED